MVRPVNMGNRLIGPNHPCFIIAEAGVNHNGDVKLARRLVKAAFDAGADAVKFQSFFTDDLVTPGAPKAEYQAKTTGQNANQYKMLKALELSPEAQSELKTLCEKMGIFYLCTPYENRSVDVLYGMDIAAFKIASTDTTNIPFLRYVTSKKRPVILSTGMSTLGEVEEAIETLRQGGLDGKIIILHCTSEYPAPINELNLRAVKTLQQAFACPVGFSDHTHGIDASPWAVAIGACVIEKHFTLDRNMVGPDHRSSIEPDELKVLVKTIRDLEGALGDGVKRVMPSEKLNKQRMQKSLVARRSIRSGNIVTPEDLTSKRPGTGISPLWFDHIIGKRVLVDISEGEILTMSSFDWTES